MNPIEEIDGLSRAVCEDSDSDEGSKWTTKPAPRPKTPPRSKTPPQPRPPPAGAFKAQAKKEEDKKELERQALFRKINAYFEYAPLAEYTVGIQRPAPGTPMGKLEDIYGQIQEKQRAAQKLQSIHFLYDALAGLTEEGLIYGMKVQEARGLKEFMTHHRETNPAMERDLAELAAKRSGFELPVEMRVVMGMALAAKTYVEARKQQFSKEQSENLPDGPFSAQA